MVVSKAINPRFEKTYKVYKHVFPNGKVYIGITSQKLNDRWKNGRGYGNNKLMQHAIAKYGWDNVEHFVLKGDFTLDEANAKERELIARYRSNEFEYGYNITSGGDGTPGIHFCLSQEAKDKISIANTGKVRTKEMRDKISKANKGRKLSQSAIEHISAGHTGLKHSTETRAKISRAAKIAQQGENNGFYGKTHSAETLKRMSEARKAYWARKRGDAQ